MPRKPLPHNTMRKAAQERKIEDFLWAAVELACYEIKVKGKTETFTGRDLQSLIDNLVTIDKHKKDKGIDQTTEDKKNVTKLKDIDSWVRQNKG